MRVAIVINTAWNIYNFRMGLLKSIREEGIEVVAIAPRDGYEQKIINEGFRFEHVSMDSTGANPLKDLKLLFNLYRVYKRIKPDIILHFTIKPNTYGSLAARCLNIPTINNVSGLGTVFLKPGFVSSIALSIYRYTFRFPKRVFFQNKYDRKLFLEKSLVRREVTDIIPGSGIDLKKFKPEINSSKNKKFTFLVISRILIDKGIVEYMEAVRILKNSGHDARFQLLGSLDTKHKRGIHEEMFNEWLDEGLIEYLGITEDVRDFIRSADCVVLPSYREGTPRTLLEAASLAKPIIATDVPGCNNVVEHNYNGFLCTPRDPVDLAEKMEKMIKQDEQTLAKMGQNSRKKVELEFDENIVIQRYIDCLHDIYNKTL